MILEECAHEIKLCNGDRKAPFTLTVFRFILKCSNPATDAVGCCKKFAVRKFSAC